MSTSIKVALIGATGFTGELIFDLLLDHPGVEVTYLAAKIDVAQRMDELFPRYRGKTDLVCHNDISIDEIAQVSDCVFLALPHTVSHQYAPAFIKAGKRVIDLSADFRLRDPEVYAKWYKTELLAPELLGEAVYGLPELNRDAIKGTRLLANPGCYPTGIILGLAPLLTSDMIQADVPVIVNSITGVSGAGRKASIALHFSELFGDIKPYKVNNHQHAPEIDQELSQLAGQPVEILFTPHLAPIDRGILSTIYVKTTFEEHAASLLERYEAFYKDEPFVRVLGEGQCPRIHNVVGTNSCEIGIAIDEARGWVIIMSAIDNLMKGASGQAVQNMNVMYGLEEKMGLKS